MLSSYKHPIFFDKIQINNWKEMSKVGKHPDLDNLDYLFECGTDFRISDKLYEEKTGASLPKGKSYLLSRSALAKKAKEKGYIIAELQEKPIIERTVILKKR